MPSSPTDDDRQEFLLSCRFGDLADVQAFVAAFPGAIPDVHDAHGNTPIHMAAGNGHADVLAYLLPRVDRDLLTRANDAGSIPLHWAAVNRHLEVVQALVSAAGVETIEVKNGAGRSALGEAESAGWEEGASWLVRVMRLEGAKEKEEVEVDSSQAIEVEIRDADGQVAKMAIDPNGHPEHS